MARLDDAQARLASSGAEQDLVELATRCMMPAPAARPQSAEQVAHAVHDHLAAAEARAATAHLRRAAKEAETGLKDLTRRKAALETKLADPQVSGRPGAELQGLQVELGEIRRAIAAAEEAWLEAQAALEEA